MMWSVEIEEAIAASKKQGIEQGIEQGIDQGEAKKALAIAERMQRRGESLETIADILEMEPEAVAQMLQNTGE